MSVYYTEELNKKSDLIAEQMLNRREIVVKVLLYKTVEGRPSLQSYVGVIKKDLIKPTDYYFNPNGDSDIYLNANHIRLLEEIMTNLEQNNGKPLISDKSSKSLL